MKPVLARRLQWAGAGTVGFLAGAVVARGTDLWRWLSSADWSTLPAATVGTAIPAIAGVVFAQSLAKRSVRSLRQAELEATEDHERTKAALATAEREARRVAWDLLFDACMPLVAGPFPPDDLAKVAFASAKAIDDTRSAEFAKSFDHSVGASNPPRPREIADSAESMATYASARGPHLRAHLPSVLHAVKHLVADHHVERLTVPLQALTLLVPVATDDACWLRGDVATIVAEADDPDSKYHSIANVCRRSYGAISDLSSVANRTRGAPLDPEEVDTSITRGGYAHQNVYTVDLLAVFSQLEDAIENLQLARP